MLSVPQDTVSDATGPDVFGPQLESGSFRDDLPEGDNTALTGPPKVGEWQDFFSRIVIRYGTDLYMNFMLRDIDPDALQPSDYVQLALTADDRKTIARPFAEYANKSKWARKNGRMIVSSADSVESILILMKWARSVSRIGRKYRKPREKTRQPLRTAQHNHQQTPNGTAAPVNGNIGPSPSPAVPSGVFVPFAGS